jgi:hypothetical protein
MALTCIWKKEEETERRALKRTRAVQLFSKVYSSDGRAKQHEWAWPSASAFSVWMPRFADTPFLSAKVRQGSLPLAVPFKLYKDCIKKAAGKGLLPVLCVPFHTRQ